MEPEIDYTDLPTNLLDSSDLVYFAEKKMKEKNVKNEGGGGGGGGVDVPKKKVKHLSKWNNSSDFLLLVDQRVV